MPIRSYVAYTYRLAMMKLTSLLFTVVILVLSPIPAGSMGNHPEASACPKDKPYVVFCSHSLHSLEGWVGGCYAQKQEAETEVESHAQQEHKGNTRWTGILQPNKAKY